MRVHVNPSTVFIPEVNSKHELRAYHEIHERITYC